MTRVIQLNATAAITPGRLCVLLIIPRKIISNSIFLNYSKFRPLRPLGYERVYLPLRPLGYERVYLPLRPLGYERVYLPLLPLGYERVYLPLRPLGYGRVYLPLYKVADTPFHIQRDDLINRTIQSNTPLHYSNIGWACLIPILYISYWKSLHDYWKTSWLVSPACIGVLIFSPTPPSLGAMGCVYEP